MLMQLVYTCILMSIMILIHSSWSVYLLGMLHKKLFTITFLTRMIITMLLVHFLEAAIFAMFYVIKSGFNSFSTAIYFSLTSYATIGYGDELLPESLRIIGAAEGLIGTLLVSWTVALLVKCLQNTTFLKS